MCRGYAPWIPFELHRPPIQTFMTRGKATGTYVHFDPVEDGGQWLGDQVEEIIFGLGSKVVSHGKPW